MVSGGRDGRVSCATRQKPRQCNPASVHYSSRSATTGCLRKSVQVIVDLSHCCSGSSRRCVVAVSGTAQASASESESSDPHSEVAHAPKIGSRPGFASASQLLHIGRPQQSPPCPSSVQRRSTSAASPRFATSATTPSGRSTRPTSLNGRPPWPPSRKAVAADRLPSRQALRYIIRNTTLPQRVRAQAQLQLSQMHCYTRFTQIKNRCIMGGKGRGVFSDFRMGRVCRHPTRRSIHALTSDSTNSESTRLPEIYLE
jgi:ribosomal protein S14